METYTPFTLQPSRLRHVWTRCLELTVPYLLGILTNLVMDYVNSVPLPPLREVLDDGLAHLVLGGVFAVIIGIFDVDEYKITIQEGYVEGPARKKMKERVRISVHCLDRTKLDERSFLDKIWGRRFLTSYQDEKILLNEAVFSRSQIEELLQRLNYSVG